MTYPAAETLGAVLDRLRSLIPRALLDGDWWKRVLACAADLPADPVAAVSGFEFRLGEPAPAADFWFPMAWDRPMAQHCIYLGNAAKPDSPQAALARFLAAAARPGSTVVRWAKGMFLEYDIAGTSSPRPPGLFLMLRPHGPGWSVPRAGVARLVAATVTDAVGRTADEREQNAVERALAALPAGACLAHAGALPGRTQRAVRLVVQDLVEAEVPGFLERLRWPGPVATACAILAGMRSVAVRFGLSFDVTADGPLPRLGLELYAHHRQDRHPQPSNDWQTLWRRPWQPFVDRLEECGWCLPAKAQGLRAWTDVQQVYSEQGVFRVFQVLSHVKITVEAEMTSAKAYACLLCAPARPRPETPDR